MMAPMQNNKPLQIPASKNWKGLTVYCSKCKTNVSETCKENGKPIKQCANGDRHFFKVYVHVPGTKNTRKTKNLETRDINEAIQLAIEFEKSVKGANQEVTKREEQKNEIKEVVGNKPRLLVNALARYIGWLHNEGVPAHMKKERSLEHIKDVERAFKLLVKGLSSKGQDIRTILVEDINDEIVGQVFSILEEKKFSNRTFNKYFSYYTSFLKFYAEEYNVPIRNWFERVKRRKLNSNPEAITKNEYEALLKQITVENGVKKYDSGVKSTRNLFRPWLSDGIQLALETGRRREEIINLKWSDIKESHGISYIVTEDYKVNRIQSRTSEEEKKYIYIPITESLQTLLTKMGQTKFGDTNKYILAPEIDISRKRVMADVLSRGFSHFYDQLDTGRNLTFKCLRKTYITNLQIHMGANTKSITGHSDNGVIERNYIDKKEIAKAAKDFNVFSKNERIEELNTIRKESYSQTKNREV